MKKIFKIFVCSVCILWLMMPAVGIAGDAYDVAKETEEHSQNAVKEAEKGNYENARIEAGEGFNWPKATKHYDYDYDVPIPDKRPVDNE